MCTFPINPRKICVDFISAGIPCPCDVLGFCQKTKSEPGIEGDGEVVTRFCTNSSTSYFTVLAVYQAVDEIAEYLLQPLKQLSSMILDLLLPGLLHH